MKKTFFIVLALLLISCKQTTTKKPEQNGQRFQVVYEQIDGIDNGYQIIYDIKTNKKYLFYKCGYSGGLTNLNDNE